MSYSGTTASSTLTNPPILVGGKIGGPVLNMGSTLIGAAGGQGAQLWFYASTETSTGILAANYFTDGSRLGMKAGDVMIAVSNTGGTTSNLVIGVITSGSTAGYGMSTGAMITSTFG